MERTESKLCTRLTDSLSGDDTDGLTLLHHALSGEVASVTLHADALLALASEHRTYLDAFDAAVLNLVCHAVCYLFSAGNDELVCLRIDDVVH